MTKFDTLYKQILNEKTGVPLMAALKHRTPTCVCFDKDKGLPFKEITEFAMDNHSIILVLFGVKTIPAPLADRVLKTIVNPTQKELSELLTSEDGIKHKVVIIKPYDMALNPSVEDRCTVVHPDGY